MWPELVWFLLGGASCSGIFALTSYIVIERNENLRKQLRSHLQHCDEKHT